MQWISVKERLPENGSRVIAFDGNKVLPVDFSIYEWGHNFNELDYYDYTEFYATHWMPLPDGPKE